MQTISNANGALLECSNYTTGGVCVSYTKNCNQFYALLPDLVFNLNNTPFKITPQGYLVPNLLPGTRCGVAVNSTIQTDFVILGATFFRNYYVSLNYVNYTI